MNRGRRITQMFILLALASASLPARAAMSGRIEWLSVTPIIRSGEFLEIRLMVRNTGDVNWWTVDSNLSPIFRLLLDDCSWLNGQALDWGFGWAGPMRPGDAPIAECQIGGGPILPASPGVYSFNLRAFCFSPQTSYVELSNSPNHVQFEVRPAWDDGYVELVPMNWRRLSWFGDYVPMGDGWNGWIWHNTHGFLYAPLQNSPQSIWLYAQDMGWLWTSSTTYPFLYRSSDSAWIWYNGSTTPRWFRNMTTGGWEFWP